MSQKPLVSICCITYNHENYIRDCIEGFLMQETTFPFEILIFDDASTDCTQTIIQEYAVKHTNIITFLQTENQWTKGRYGILDWLLPNVKGDFIALCEGDDYWSNSFKLQKQIDFLRVNNSYSFCGHKSLILSKNNQYYPMEGKVGDVDLSDGLLGFVTHTSSMVFRTIKIRDFVKKLDNSPVIDAALVSYLLSLGKGYIFSEVMSVYRLHNGGVYSALNSFDTQIVGIKVQIWKLRKFPSVITFQLESIAKRYMKLAMSSTSIISINSKLSLIDNFFIFVAISFYLPKSIIRKIFFIGPKV